MSLLLDLRQTGRSLGRRPAFLLGAALTTALGVGASTAVFSVAEAILLRPFPYADAERLVSMREIGSSGEPMSVAWPNFVDWRDQSRSFTGMAAWRLNTLTLLDREGAQSLPARQVSVGYFELLGQNPELGRFFTDQDDRPGVGATVVLGEGLWRRRFGADPAILGRSLLLGGRSHVVVGIAPAALADFQRTDVWVPLGLIRAEMESRGLHNALLALGRLPPGMSLASAQQEMDAIAARLGERYPDTNRGVRVEVTSQRERVVGGVRPMLRLAGAAGALLLLVACGNVASLLLARAVSRDAELALRAALGAGRLRLARQLWLEALLLSLLGGVGGVLLAWAGTHALLAMRPNLPLIDRLSMNPAVLGFALLVALASGLAFGSVPLLRLRLRSLAPRLGGRGDGGGAAGAARLRGALVVGQVALSVVLLVAAGLLGQSLYRVLSVPLGFEPADAMALTVEPTADEFPQVEAWREYVRRAEENVATLPGVTAVGLTTSLPLAGASSESSYWIEGTPRPTPGSPMRSAQHSHVSAGYFEAMEIERLAGRDFDATDRADGVPVAIVDESLAREMVPGTASPAAAVGRRLAFQLVGEQPLLREVVGVVRRTQHYDLEGEGPAYPQLYVPIEQYGHDPEDVGRRPPLTLVVRASEAATLAPAVRARLAKADPRQPVVELSSLGEVVARATSGRRLPAALLGTFAAVTMLLTLVGIHALLAFQVAQSRRDIGIRLAIGGTPAAVVRGFLRRGARLAGAGVAIGLLAAVAARRLWAGMLFGVGADDPWTYGLAAALLLVATLGAAALPARRAARVDPVRALRSE